MARKLRLAYPRAIYHVMNRRDRREAIFTDDAGRRRFLDCLGEACARTQWPVHAFCLRACLETTRGAAAGDFGCGQGGEFRASPQRAVRNEPTPATDKRPAARRVFGEKAVWLCCSSVEDPPGIFSFVAPSGLFPENSAPRSFQTVSDLVDIVSSRVKAELLRLRIPV